MNLKDTIRLANRLDSLGRFTEADAIDRNLRLASVGGVGVDFLNQILKNLSNTDFKAGDEITDEMIGALQLNSNITDETLDFLKSRVGRTVDDSITPSATPHSPSPATETRLDASAGPADVPSRPISETTEALGDTVRPADEAVDATGDTARASTPPDSKVTEEADRIPDNLKNQVDEAIKNGKDPKQDPSLNRALNDMRKLNQAEISSFAGYIERVTNKAVDPDPVIIKDELEQLIRSSDPGIADQARRIQTMFDGVMDRRNKRITKTVAIFGSIGLGAAAAVALGVRNNRTPVTPAALPRSGAPGTVPAGGIPGTIINGGFVPDFGYAIPPRQPNAKSNRKNNIRTAQYALPNGTRVTFYPATGNVVPISAAPGAMPGGTVMPGTPVMPGGMAYVTAPPAAPTAPAAPDYLGMLTDIEGKNAAADIYSTNNPRGGGANAIRGFDPTAAGIGKYFAGMYAAAVGRGVLPNDALEYVNRQMDRFGVDAEVRREFMKQR